MWQRFRSRFWMYARDEWEQDRRWVPSIGSDGFSCDGLFAWRRTIVLAVPFSGWLVVAYGLWKVEEEGS